MKAGSICGRAEVGRQGFGVQPGPDDPEIETSLNRLWDDSDEADEMTTIITAVPLLHGSSVIRDRHPLHRKP